MASRIRLPPASPIWPEKPDRSLPHRRHNAAAMRLPFRVIIFAAFLGSFGRAAHAQATGNSDAWSFGVNFAESYEGNPSFVGASQQDEWANQIGGFLGRSWTLRRGSAQLSAAGSRSFYQETTALNDFRYNFGGSLSYALTHRLSWGGNIAVNSGLARDSKVLIDAGLVLPSVDTRTINSSSTFSYQLSPRSQISWSIAQLGVGFSSLLFSGGTELTSSLRWTRQVTRSQTIGVTQDYSRSFSDAGSSTIHGLVGTWAAPFGRGWSGTVGGGVRPYTVPGEGYRFAPATTASLSKNVRPGQTLGISYDRSVTQTFGIGRTNNLLQSVSAGYGFTLARNLTTTFGSSYSVGTDPLDENLQLTGTTAQASISYLIKSIMTVGLGSNIYRRTYTGAEPSTSYRVAVSLSYGKSW